MIRLKILQRQHIFSDIVPTLSFTFSAQWDRCNNEKLKLHQSKLKRNHISASNFKKGFLANKIEKTQKMYFVPYVWINLTCREKANRFSRYLHVCFILNYYSCNNAVISAAFSVTATFLLNKCSCSTYYFNFLYQSSYALKLWYFYTRLSYLPIVHPFFLCFCLTSVQHTIRILA